MDSMTAISSSAADSFIDRLPGDVQFFLVHGPDEGLAHERCKAIVGKRLGGDTDPLRLVRLDGDALARDPGLLADEAYAIPMFGGARAVWIDAQGRDFLSALEPVLNNPPDDCSVIVKAPQLKKGSPLRSLFENAKNATSIECFWDESRSLAALIDKEVRATGLRISAKASEALLELLGEDRYTSSNEITKLMTYAISKTCVEIEDVEAIVSDVSPSGLDGLIDETLLGELSGSAADAAEYFAAGGDCDQLLARLSARLILLYRLRLEMDQGRAFNSAWQTLAARASPKGRRAINEAAEHWTQQALGQRAVELRDAMARIRSNPKLAKTLTTRALLVLAAKARPAPA